MNDGDRHDAAFAAVGERNGVRRYGQRESRHSIQSQRAACVLVHKQTLINVERQHEYRHPKRVVLARDGYHLEYQSRPDAFAQGGAAVRNEVNITHRRGLERKLSLRVSLDRQVGSLDMHGDAWDWLIRVIQDNAAHDSLRRVSRNHPRCYESRGKPRISGEVRNYDIVIEAVLRPQS